MYEVWKNDIPVVGYLALRRSAEINFRFEGYLPVIPA